MSFMSELLDRCENSDDADKREIAVYVRKLEGIRDRLEKQLHQARTETTHVTRALNNCAKARGELAELKERYRWRDASKEPAPKLADDRTRFVLVHERQYETMTTAQYFYEDKTWYDFGGESVDVDYWRPLEFPEEESK